MQTTVNGTISGGSGIGVTAALDAFLQRRAAAGARPNTVAAYRRDIEGVLDELFPPGGEAARTQPVNGFSLEAFIDAFGRWASRHKPSSVRRAWSAWNAFWSDLVERRLRSQSPMPYLGRPSGPSDDANAPVPVSAWRLQAIASAVDGRSRHPWPERDSALVGLLLGTGIRLGELDDLRVGSITPTRPAALRIVDVVGNERLVPIDDDLHEIVRIYLESRRRRFPGDDVDDPAAPMLVDHEGHALARHQAQYIVRRLFERAGVSGDLRRGSATTLLRHAYASNLVHEGVDAGELQRRLGERSVATVRRHTANTALEPEGGDVRARQLAAQAVRIHHQREEIARRMEALAHRIRVYQRIADGDERYDDGRVSAD